MPTDMLFITRSSASICGMPHNAADKLASRAVTLCFRFLIFINIWMLRSYILSFELGRFTLSCFILALLNSSSSSYSSLEADLHSLFLHSLPFSPPVALHSRCHRPCRLRPCTLFPRTAHLLPGVESVHQVEKLAIEATYLFAAAIGVARLVTPAIGVD